ncbi:MAG: glycerate kinase, partial [Bacteroidales bacterium]|nr:glycerate kinase [Bacteroidales bacterium]
LFPDCETVMVPVADGGEGTAEAIASACGGQMVSVPVHDPLMRPIKAEYGVIAAARSLRRPENFSPGSREVNSKHFDACGSSSRALARWLAGSEEPPASKNLDRPPLGAAAEFSTLTAVIDVAAASGLPLLKRDELNPMKASTYGTGELILDALDRGCRDFIIGLGGSATNDGGMGMLEALGFRFLGADGKMLSTDDGLPMYGCGEAMAKIASIDVSGVADGLRESRFRVACDVNTPFCGPAGAAEIFAPQKGADQRMVRALDEGMANFAAVISRTAGLAGAEYTNGDMAGPDISRVPGTGAAGGLGGAFLAFLGACLTPGIELVLDTVRFDERIAGADMVITGEGKMDSQTLKGKTPFGILQHAKAQGIRTVAVCGKCLDRQTLIDAGFADIREISPASLTLEQMMEPSTAKANVRRTVQAIVTDFSANPASKRP